MSTTIDDYRSKLLKKILLADSQQDVRRFIHTAMKSLAQHKVNGHIVARFITKMLQDLGQLSRADKSPGQWNNITVAMVSFNRIGEQLLSGKTVLTPE